MQNFGKIRNAYNELYIDSKIKQNKEKVKIFKQYVSLVKENKALRTEFLLYSNLEDAVETNDLKGVEIIKSNLALLKKFSKKSILEAHNILVENLGKYKNRLERPYESAKEKLHENITNLIFTKETSKNINMITESIMDVLSYIKENIVKEPLSENYTPTNMLATLAVRKFNDKYSDLSEDEKNLFKSIINSNEETQKENYNSLIRECIDLIDEKLDKSNIETKDKLLKVKDKLLRSTFISESYAEDFTKIIELKESLNN